MNPGLSHDDFSSLCIVLRSKGVGGLSVSLSWFRKRIVSFISSLRNTPVLTLNWFQSGVSDCCSCCGCSRSTDVSSSAIFSVEKVPVLPIMGSECVRCRDFFVLCWALVEVWSVWALTLYSQFCSLICITYIINHFKIHTNENAWENERNESRMEMNKSKNCLWT